MRRGLGRRGLQRGCDGEGCDGEGGCGGCGRVVAHLRGHGARVILVWGRARSRACTSIHTHALHSHARVHVRRFECVLRECCVRAIVRAVCKMLARLMCGLCVGRAWVVRMARLRVTARACSPKPGDRRSQVLPSQHKRVTELYISAQSLLSQHISAQTLLGGQK